MRAALLTVAVAVLGAGCHGADLRQRVNAAGVFSPVRVAVGDPDLVTLGQTLFFDPELSGNRNMACANCHVPQRHATDGLVIARGQDHARLSRQSPALFNRGGSEPFFWDGRLEMSAFGIVGPVALPPGLTTLLEAQALLPLLDRNEMRGHVGDSTADGRPNELAALGDDDTANRAVWQAVVARLVALDGYKTLFAKAYPAIQPSDLTIVHVARALAAFEERLWELSDTPFDLWLGSVSVPALTQELDGGDNLRGAELFFGDAGCSRCHNGPLLSDGKYHSIGVPQIGAGREPNHADLGRYAVTMDPADRFAFRTPPLRNVALTPPYMHDGAYMELEAAVRHHLNPVDALTHYDSVLLPIDLNIQLHPELNDEIAATIDPATAPLRTIGDDEVAQLVSFLMELSSFTEETLPMDAAIPANLPSGLTYTPPATTDLVGQTSF